MSLVAASSFRAGAIWFTLASVLSKSASFIAQIVLGWLLLPEDFGVYALALSISALAAGLRNGGSDQYLTQKGTEFSRHAGEVLIYSTGFNLLALAGLMCAGVVAHIVYQKPMLFWLLMLMGVGWVLAGPATLMRLSLSAGRLYKALTLATTCSDLTRQGSSILFALLGMGAVSLALPIVLEPMVLALVVFALVRTWPKTESLCLDKAKRLFSACRWNMLSNFAIALSLSGIYLVVSTLAELSDVGLFYFAMQLIVAATVPITNTINNVYFPHVANHQATSAGQIYAISGLKTALMLGFFLSVLLVLSIEPLVLAIWGERWHAAIPAAEYLAFCAAPLVFNTLVYSLYAARAQWPQRFAVIFAGALVDMIALAIGLLEQDLQSGALALALGKILYSAGLVWLTARWFPTYSSTAFLRSSFGLLALLLGLGALDLLLAHDGLAHQAFRLMLLCCLALAAVRMFALYRGMRGTGHEERDA